MYLTAIMDWYSRYVVSWELSESLESDFCISEGQILFLHLGKAGGQRFQVTR